METIENGIRFKRENGMCPYFINEGYRYWIQDKRFDDHFEYALYRRKMGHTVKHYQNDEHERNQRGMFYENRRTLLVAERFMRGKKCRYRSLGNGMYEYLWDGKQLIVSVPLSSICVRYEDEFLSGWYDSYDACLCAAKRLLSEQYVGAQMIIDLAG